MLASTLIATWLPRAKNSPSPLAAVNRVGSSGPMRSSNWNTAVSCHGPDAKGLPGLGKDLTTSNVVKGQAHNPCVESNQQGRRTRDPAKMTNVDMPPRSGDPALTDTAAFIRSVNT
jgi:disulfide bond formation protein DsbB